MFTKLNRFIRNFFNYGDYKVSIVADSISPKLVRLTTYLIEGELTLEDRQTLIRNSCNVYTINNKNLVTVDNHPSLDSYRIGKMFKSLRMANKPETVYNAKWHIPFKNNIDYTKLYFFVKENEKDFGNCAWCEEVIIDRYMLRIATARCFEINNEKSNDFKKDIETYNSIKCVSAMKHIAQAQNDLEIHDNYYGWKGADLFWINKA